MSDDTPTPEERRKDCGDRLLRDPIAIQTTEAVIDHVDALVAEIATLRQERDECCEFCNKPHFSGAGEAQGMEVCTDCWNDQFRRREAAEAENARLRAGIRMLVEAKRCDASVMVCGFLDDLIGLLAPPAETKP